MEELLTFYGILITSGYSSVPRRHMYWSLDSDVHNESISDAMRRNRFDEIMASIHVVDNTKITDDPFFKVPQGCKFIHDNLFTSLGLLDEMKKRRYGSSGTMRQTSPQKEFMKLSRGTSEVLTQGDKLLVHWKDNNVVTVATNMEEKY
ncbi:hypothetical protein F7725_026968, partial [Dissostichus mawsoni]